MPKLLSFCSDMEPVELCWLNVLIGHNESIKSNVIEALEPIKSTSTDSTAAIRAGGGAAEWIWKGRDRKKAAIINVETAEAPDSLVHPSGRPSYDPKTKNRIKEVVDKLSGRVLWITRS